MEDYSLLCPICIESYSTPRLIKACGHSFCEQCLFTYVTTLQDKGELGSTFPCPVCRQEVTAPSDSNLTLSWIQTFSISEDLLNKLSKTPLKIHADTENKPTSLCDPCVAENEQNKAVKFCVDCQEYLCKDCVAAHKKYKILRGHKLSEVTEAEQLNKFKDLPQTKCAEHTTRDIEMYCGRHDTFCCSDCIFQSHIECPGLMHISKMESTALKRLKNLKEKLEKSEKHVEGLISLNDSILSDLGNNKQKIIDRLKEIRDKIVTAVNGLIENAEVQTKQQLIGLEAELTMKAETLQKMGTKCQTLCKMIDTVSECGLPIHKVLAQSKVSVEFVKMEKDIHTQINGQKMESVDFGFDGIEKFEQLYGELQKCSNEQVKIVRKMIDTTKCEPALNKSKMKKEEHTVILVQGCSPTYTGITVKDDEHLLLTDNCNNVCGYVCLYNVVSRSIRTKLKLKRPFSAAVLKSNPSHIVVSIPQDKQLHIISIKGDQMMIEKTFQCDKKPYSLISLDNGNVGITWDSQPSYSIVDINVNEMRMVKTFTQDSTGRQFKSFEHVAVDELRSHIIQPCYKAHTVYCFDYSGNFVFEYKDPELKHPCGVDKDTNGNIYVCSKANNKIHVLTPCGQKVKVFDVKPVKPTGISVEEAGDRFWVSCFSNFEKLYLFSFA